ncbi:MAG: sulfatase [Acidobacteria bacterium]|nr:sulfatase [Acidobacteriota bacterium]
MMLPLSRRDLLAAFAAQVARQQLNIVFLLADDLGWADTQLNGGDLHETPNLLRLARSGVRFTHALAAAPVCSPTRASIMTGKFPARLHITIWRESSRNPPKNRRVVPPIAEADLPHTETTLAELIRSRGYSTAHIGKWHLGSAEHYPETHGFDVNVGGTLWGAPETFWFPYGGKPRWNEPRYVPGLGHSEPGEYLTDRLTTEAIQRMKRRGGKPFFVNLWFHSPHTPIEGKPELTAKFKARIRPEMKHQNPEYAAMVASIDGNVGRILDHLEGTGELGRTIIVFTSDNGGYIGKDRGQQIPVTNNHPLRSGKGSLYEGGLRVPLVIHWPGAAKPGAVCGEMVFSADLYPTLAEAAGAQPQPGIDSMSLTPLLRDPAARLSRERLYFHYPHYYETTTPVSAVRERDWKLLEYHEDSRVELFNLANDPGESRDLAASEPRQATRLRELLHRWRAEVGAQMPTRRIPE